MYASMKMMCKLHSQSMCEKLQVEVGVQSLLAALYNLQQGWMKKHPFELQPSIQFVAASKELKWSFVPKANTCSKIMFLTKGLPLSSFTS